jgi:hypothetical protein
MPNHNGPERWKSEGPEIDGDSVDASSDAVLPGDTTVPTWALLSIVLGLVALTGSIVAMCIAGTVALLGWVVCAAGNEKDPGGRASEGPFGAADSWP